MYNIYNIYITECRSKTRYPPIGHFLIFKYQYVKCSFPQMGYISHLSEIIFLPAKNRIEIILFFQNALCPLALFSKTHYIHLVTKA